MKQKKYVVTNGFNAYDVRGKEPSDLELVEFTLTTGEVITKLNANVKETGVKDGHLMVIDRISKPVVILDYDYENNIEEITQQKSKISIVAAIEVEKVEGMAGSTQYITEGERINVQRLNGEVVNGRFLNLEQSVNEEEPDHLVLFVDHTNNVMRIPIDDIKDI